MFVLVHGMGTIYVNMIIKLNLFIYESFRLKCLIMQNKIRRSSYIVCNVNISSIHSTCRPFMVIYLIPIMGFCSYRMEAREGSDETAQLRSLIRAFPVRTHNASK